MKRFSTKYKNIEFDSDLEACWAYFFDTLEERYEYKPKAFQLEMHLWYCPSFWLFKQEVWVEIVIDLPKDIQIQKAVALFQATKKNVFIFSGFPQVKFFRDNQDLTQNKYIQEICNFG